MIDRPSLRYFREAQRAQTIIPKTVSGRSIGLRSGAASQGVTLGSLREKMPLSCRVSGLEECNKLCNRGPWGIPDQRMNLFEPDLTEGFSRRLYAVKK